jgi:hypothetical protein
MVKPRKIPHFTTLIYWLYYQTVARPVLNICSFGWNQLGWMCESFAVLICPGMLAHHMTFPMIFALKWPIAAIRHWTWIRTFVFMNCIGMALQVLRTIEASAAFRV